MRFGAKTLVGLGLLVVVGWGGWAMAQESAATARPAGMAPAPTGSQEAARPAGQAPQPARPAVAAPAMAPQGEAPGDRTAHAGGADAPMAPGGATGVKAQGGPDKADKAEEDEGEDEGEEEETAKKKRPAGCMGQYGTVIMLVALFGIFYFMLIRPQQKKQKEHQEMLDQLKVGDRVLTQGGILGKITGFRDPFVVLEVQEKVRIKVLRSSVSTKYSQDSGNK